MKTAQHLTVDDLNLEEEVYDDRDLTVFSYSYYDTPVRINYRANKHMAVVQSTALPSTKPENPAPSHENLDTQYVENLLREETGLHYQSRRYGPVGEVPEPETGFVQILLEPGSGLEIRDLYDETVAEILQPRHGSGFSSL